MRDLRGVEVEVGDVVTYSTRHSSYMSQVIGEVVAIKGERAQVRVKLSEWGAKWGRPLRSVSNRYLVVVEKASTREALARLADLEK